MRRTLIALSLAFAAFAHEGLHEQLEALSQRIAKEPANAELFLQRGELYRLHREWDAARADYDRAAKLDAKLAVDFARGRMELEAGELTAARRYLDAFLARNPEHAEAHLARARTLVRLKQTAAALADYDAAITHAVHPTPDLYAERAKLQSPADAVRGLDEGLTRLGPLISLQLQAIDFELAAGRIDAALARLDAILARAPRKEQYLMMRGEILAKARRNEEANAAYRAALQSIEQLPAARRNNRRTRELVNRIASALCAGDRGGTEAGGPCR
ncbi:MAG: tetratricopeptide repeat protein [Thermoanaerobaculia bacterium]